MFRVDTEALEQFATAIVEAVGAPTDAAKQMASSFVEADVRDHGSHGLLQLSSYVERIETHDWVDPTATPVVERETNWTALVDGRMNFGQITGRKAVDVGVSKAESTGIACVGVRNAAHLGRIGEWAERASERGFLFVAFVSTTGTSRLWVAPPGSAERRFSTNPIAIGIPTFDARPFPVVLDMATSQVAVGKLREREQKGASVPPAWTVTDDDGYVDDPSKFFDERQGAVRPLGGEATGHKGYGLSIVTELFAGIVANEPISGQPGPKLTRNIGSFLFIDPTMFTTREAVEARITAFAEHLRATNYSDRIPRGAAARDGDGLLPGEYEHRMALERREHGVPIPAGTADALWSLAERYSCSDVLPPVLS